MPHILIQVDYSSKAMATLYHTLDLLGRIYNNNNMDLSEQASFNNIDMRWQIQICLLKANMAVPHQFDPS